MSQVIDYVKNPEKTEGMSKESLKDLVQYVGRPGATEKGELVTGLWCDPEKALEQMMSVKMRWGKEGGTIAYHGYQSFAEGEVTPKLAHEIGVELAERLWGDRYQVLIATHTDKQSHIHNHFVINTVSFIDGKKFRRTPQDYDAMRTESDKLCSEKLLSVIKEPKSKGVGYREWKEAKEGFASSVRSLIRKDIDLAISESASWNDFLESMEGFGYRFKLYKKDGELLERPSLLPPEGECFMRFYKLGAGYDVDQILDRILFHKEKPELAYTARQAQLVSAYWRMNKPRKTPRTLEGLYQRYIFELRVVKKWPHIRRALPMETRVAAARLASYERQHKLLKENGIETLRELNAFRDNVAEQLSHAEKQRGAIRSELRGSRRGSDDGRSAALLLSLKEVSGRISQLRWALKDSNEIADRSLSMRQEIDAIDAKWEDYKRKNPALEEVHDKKVPGLRKIKTKEWEEQL